MAQRNQLLKWPGTRGLVGWWRFEGTAAKTLSVPDQTGNKAMTLVQGTSLIQDLWPTRGDRYCLGFDGLNDATRYGSMSFGTSDPAYFGTGAQTVGTSITAICVAHAIGNGGNGNGRLFEYANLIDMILVNNSLRGNIKTIGTTITGTAPSITYLSTGRPVVFAFTYSVSDQTLRIITNGTQGTAVQDLGAGNPGTNGTASAAFRLSSQASLASQLNGQIMELAIFKNRQLSASECYNFIYARRPSLRGSRVAIT